MSSAYSVESDIRALSARNNKLERLVSRLGTGAETDTLWDRITDEKNANTNLVKKLLSDLKGLPEGSGSRGELERSFRTEYERFKQLRSRIKSGGGGGGGDESFGGGQDYGGGQQDQQQLSLNLREVERVEEEERKAQRVKALNRDVQDIADMSNDMKALVDQQGETVDQIVIKTEVAKSNTGSAAQEFQKADEYLTAARKRYLWIAIICAVIIAILGVVIYLVTKK